MNTEKARRLRRWAFIATLATYVVIFTGGLVRVSGAGLGCPDWPRCFGRWLPPTDVSQLPPDIDPSRFNMTLAWIEYSNRLIGVVVGFLIAVTAVLALKDFRRVPRVLWPAILAALFVALEGWQGGVVVASELQPLVVSVHTLLAFLIVSLLIYVTLQAWFLERPAAVSGLAPKRSRLWIGLLWLLSMIQVVLGTDMRSSIERMREQLPLGTTGDWLYSVGGRIHVHLTLGLLLLLFTFVVVIRLWQRADRLPAVLRPATGSAALLIVAQTALGLSFLAFGVPAAVQVFHLWLASLYIGTVLVMFVATPAFNEART